MTTGKTTLTTDELRQAIEPLPRVKLAHLPTPLEELPRLSKALGGPRIFIKRDDCTGLALGGNKARHNEFVVGEAVHQGADIVVWGAGIQSNNCRQTAAACARLGLDIHLLLSRGHSSDDIQGNLLLDHLLGATYEIVDAEIGPELDAAIIEAADRYRAEGRKVFNYDRGVVKIRSAVSYVLCMAELVDQLAERGVEPAAVFVCSGGSTGAGLALAKAALGAPFALHNILPIRWPWDTRADLARIANETAECLKITTTLERDEINITDNYVGEDYGIPTPECMEAIELLARKEGIILDPNYTGKAMAGLIDHIRQGRYSADDAVVFIHTGGTPLVFAYRDVLVEMIAPKG